VSISDFPLPYIDFLPLRFRKLVCLSGGEDRYQCAYSQNTIPNSAAADDVSMFFND
jgi:hypothetical protein